jgi:hypothetical protein
VAAPGQRNALSQAGAGTAAFRIARLVHDPCAAADFQDGRNMTIAGRRSYRTLAVGLVALALSACALRSPSIGDLRYNPGRYYDRTVSIEGVVTSSWGVPLVPFRMYKVGDSTGEITVVSDRGRVPPRGTRVRVRGRVSDVGMFGGQSIGLHLRETSLHVIGRRW